MKQFLLIISLLFISLGLTQAQENSAMASITGKVLDANSGYPLIGATVFLPDLNIGVITDFEGEYRIANLQAGNYKLQCTYLGFASQTIENISLEAGQNFQMDFSLKEDALSQNEVVVEAKQIRSTANALLTIKRQSSQVLDGVSAAEIKKTGDNDAAAAMRRITGVTVEGGKYVYVRGLSDRYSKTTLNGAEIPSLDPNRNSVQMDLFPANLIDNILVYKSFSPNLYGDFTGGYIDIETKDFPELFSINASLSTSYNTVSSFNPNLNSYAGSSTDLLGFDDGLRQLPSTIPNIEEGQLPEFEPNSSANFNAADAQTIAAASRSFANNWEQSGRSRFLNSRASFSIGNQTKLFGKPLGFIASLSYSQQASGYTNGNYGIYELGGNSQTTNRLTSQLQLEEQLGRDETLWGAMLGASYKLNKNNQLRLTVLRNQSATSTARYAEGTKFRDDPDDVFISQSWRFLERSLGSYQLGGKHFIPKWKNLEIKWQSAYSLSAQDEPDLRYFTYRYRPDQDRYFLKLSSDNSPSRFYREMNESTWSNRVDFSLPYKQWNGLSAKLMAGASYNRKARVFRENRIVFQQSGIVPFNGNLTDYFAEEQLVQYDAGENQWANNGQGLYADSDIDLQNSYDAQQDVLGLYLMTELPITKKLRLVTGLRMEQTRLSMLSLDPSLQAIDSLHLDQSSPLLENLDLLPALSLNYELNDKMKLRFAYSRTLARPSFRELAPYTNFDVDGGYLLAGNPNLQRSLADNIDLRYEFYPSFAELISVTAFFKQFYNPIERTFNPTAPNSEITFRNVEEAQILGLELELRKNLGFIAAPLKSFSLAANFAYIYSETKIDPLELAEIRATVADAKDSRPMFGQSPYSANLLLAYKNDYGTEANLVFNVIGPRISLIVRGGTPNVYEQPVPLLGFNLAQDLGKGFRLSFRANNLLGSRYRESLEYKGKEYFIQRYDLGQSFSLGVNYRFNRAAE